MKSLSAKLLLLALPLFIWSSVSSAALYKFKGIVDVKNGRLFPFNAVEITGDKITRLTTVGPKDHYLDFSDLYLSPGLIDAHSHIFITQRDGEPLFSNAVVRELQLSKVERIERAKKYLRDYLKEGFTSLFDLGNSGEFYDAELRDQISNNPDFPMLFVSGPGISTYPGQFPAQTPLTDVQKEYTIIDKKTDVSALIEKYLAKKTDFLKIYLDNYPGPGKMDEDVLKKILSHPKIKLFKKVTFHSFIPESGLLLKKFKIKATEHFNFYDKDQLPTTLRYLTPTNFDIETMKQFHQYSPVYYLHQQNVLKALSRSKVKILFGPDFYFDDVSRPDLNRAQLVKRTLNSYIAADFAPKDILKMITLYPAQSIGMDKKLGQIGLGAFANLVGTKVNPLENASALLDISLVVSKGKFMRSK